MFDQDSGPIETARPDADPGLDSSQAAGTSGTGTTLDGGKSDTPQVATLSVGLPGADHVPGRPPPWRPFAIYPDPVVVELYRNPHPTAWLALLAGIIP